MGETYREDDPVEGTEAMERDAKFRAWLDKVNAAPSAEARDKLLKEGFKSEG